MITAFVTSVDQDLANTGSNLLWFSAAVLTLSMLAFVLDLAGAPGREARAKERAARAVEKEESAGGGTAVLERTDVAEDQPEKRVWAARGMMLAWLGTFLLLASTAARAFSVHRAPLGNMYEFALVGCSFLMLVYVLWALKHDVRWLGAPVTGLTVLFQMLAAVVFYTDASKLMPSLQSYWLSIHVSVATLSIALFSVAFLLHLLYFGQLWRANGREDKLPFMRSVPKADVLDRYAYGVIIVAFPLWTFTLIAGAIWAQEAWGQYWSWDPKEVWTLVIWVLYAAYLHARVTAGWSGRKASYVAVAGYVAILINYGIVNVFFVGMHSYSGM